MESYEWPGNVRELENKVQRSVILSEGGRVEAHDMDFQENYGAQRTQEKHAGKLKEAKDRLERTMLVNTLDKCRRNIAKAAEELVGFPSMTS